MSCSHCPSPAQGADTASSDRKEPTVLLVGNPNVGKSTMFNALTGSRQAVVNAPGTTVEVQAGRCEDLRVLDLPGTYSLVAQSPDEQAVVDTLVGAPGCLTDAERGAADLVVCFLDATALTRSLYLLGQVARVDVPVVALLTLNDVAAQEGSPVDPQRLSEVLGIPVLAANPKMSRDVPAVVSHIRSGIGSGRRVRGVPPCSAAAWGEQGADQLFEWVADVESQLGVAPAGAELSRSDRIDRFLLHPAVGIPVFFALMWLLFMISGKWVGPLMDFFDGLFASREPGAWSLANALDWLLAQAGWDGGALQGFLVSGLATGLGVVASFVPLMFVIFLLVSILEDSGYMARAAFLGDRVMRKIGLDGRVILPLIMGFGCNLPALAAARSLPNQRHRLVTVLVTPYTSCAARLTIYLMIARIFFPDHVGTVVFGLYVLSLLMVVLGALALKPFFTRESSSAPLMLVLPPYGAPQVLLTLRTTWGRSWAFVKGAGKIIVAMTVVVWLLGAIPTTAGHRFADPDLPASESVYGSVARSLVPVFKPTGFGEWHMTGALMTGFVAKETVISSIAVSYNLDESAAGDAEDGGADLGELPALVDASFAQSAGDARAPAALAFLVFVLLYTPCLATVAEQVRQVGARLSLAAMGAQMLIAYLMAVGVFQIGRLFV